MTLTLMHIVKIINTLGSIPGFITKFFFLVYSFILFPPDTMEMYLLVLLFNSNSTYKRSVL